MTPPSSCDSGACRRGRRRTKRAGAQRNGGTNARAVMTAAGCACCGRRRRDTSRHPRLRESDGRRRAPLRRRVPHPGARRPGLSRMRGVRRARPAPGVLRAWPASDLPAGHWMRARADFAGRLSAVRFELVARQEGGGGFRDVEMSRLDYHHLARVRSAASGEEGKVELVCGTDAVRGAPGGDWFHVVASAVRADGTHALCPACNTAHDEDCSAEQREASQPRSARPSYMRAPTARGEHTTHNARRATPPLTFSPSPTRRAYYKMRRPVGTLSEPSGVSKPSHSTFWRREAVPLKVES